MIEISDQELAVILATRCSEYAQSAEQLAQMIETSHVQGALISLVQRNILQDFEGYTTDGKVGTVYGYAANDYAQHIYDVVHGLTNTFRY